MSCPSTPILWTALLSATTSERTFVTIDCFADLNPYGICSLVQYIAMAIRTRLVLHLASSPNQFVRLIQDTHITQSLLYLLFSVASSISQTIALLQQGKLSSVNIHFVVSSHLLPQLTFALLASCRQHSLIMETLSQMATSAAKLAFGDKNNTEPVSGVQGDVSKGQPYDAGNLGTQSPPLVSHQPTYGPLTSKP